MDPFWSVAFCLCAAGSEGGTGDSSPETALLAALAHGQTSCSVFCIIRMFLEVSEMNRTPYSLLCWAGHQGVLFLQRRMVKMWNVALQIWLLLLRSEEPTSSAGFASSACLLSQYSPSSALRKYPKMHSRPSVCTERWFIHLACLGLLSVGHCSVAAAGIWGIQALGSPSHPHRGPV